MSDLLMDSVPFVESVFHPTDFSKASARAFAHALAIALKREARLTLFHVEKEDSAGYWSEYPSVRGTLEKWGLLEEGASKSDVHGKLGVIVKKVDMPARRVHRAVMSYIGQHEIDLIVLATEGRDGIPRWLQPSLAEKLSREARTMTLYVPEAARGFVSLQDGRLSLKRILVPIDYEPAPRQAVEVAARAARMVDGAGVEIRLLHLGSSGRMPAVDIPEIPGTSWKKEARRGDAVGGILAAVDSWHADLIIMATSGRDGVLDALRGSVTEQVVRGAGCPVLAVPGP